MVGLEVKDIGMDELNGFVILTATKAVRYLMVVAVRIESGGLNEKQKPALRTSASATGPLDVGARRLRRTSLFVAGVVDRTYKASKPGGPLPEVHGVGLRCYEQQAGESWTTLGCPS
jgi:hypothetical protein